MMDCDNDGDKDFWDFGFLAWLLGDNPPRGCFGWILFIGILIAVYYFW